MLICKYIILFFIFLLSSRIGVLIAKKYKERVEILQEFKTLLSNLKAKIKFTYQPLPETFKQISECSKKINQKGSKIFEKASIYMENMTAGEAWINAIDESNIIRNEEDKKVLKNMGNLLGKTDIEGQVNDIDLTISFLEEQIIIAQKDVIKNEKLYKNLGTIIGIAIVIILF